MHYITPCGRHPGLFCAYLNQKLAATKLLVVASFSPLLSVETVHLGQKNLADGGADPVASMQQMFVHEKEIKGYSRLTR